MEKKVTKMSFVSETIASEKVPKIASAKKIILVVGCIWVNTQS